MARRFFHRVIIVWVALALAAMPVLATAAAPTADKATGFIDQIGKDVMAVLNDKSMDSTSQDRKFQDLFRSKVDLDWIGRFVLGKYWRTASDAQQKRYLESYRVFIIKSYTSKFKEYSGSESYKILGSKPDGDGKYLVTMEILRPKEAPVMIDYKLRNEEGGELRIYDIVVEGVSLLTTQRSEFGSVVSRKGLDYLIEQIEKRAKS